MGEQKEVLTILSQELGNGPVLRWYFERMRLVETINEVVSRKGEGLSCGEAVAALVAMILNRRHALYAMEQWAEERAVLASIFPHRPPQAYTDDQLGRCLDALWAAGLVSVHSLVSAAMVQGFGLEVRCVHHDTTSFSFYGAYEAGDEEGTGAGGRAEPSREEPAEHPLPLETPQPPRITYGYSRDKRPDLKQVVAGLTVDQAGIPLLGTVHDGNHADGPNYVAHWLALSEVLGRSDFLYLGDTKLYSQTRVAEILGHGGAILCPMPMTPKEQRQVADARAGGELQFTAVAIGQKIYGIWETEFEIVGAEEQRYSLRKVVVYSERLAEKERRTRQGRLERATTQLQELKKNVGRYKLKTLCAIEHAARKVVEQYQVQAYLTIRVDVTRESVRKQVGRGRPGPATAQVEQEHERYSLSVEPQSEALQQAALCDGVYLLCCSVAKEQLSPAAVLQAYKGQDKVERGHRDLKGPIAVVPLYLHKPERIAAMTLLCIIALQVVRLMEWQARQSLQTEGEPLRGLLPNRLLTQRPSGVKMLDALKSIALLTVVAETGHRRVLSQLSALQTKLLQVLGVPLAVYMKCPLLENFQPSG